MKLAPNGTRNLERIGHRGHRAAQRNSGEIPKFGKNSEFLSLSFLLSVLLCDLCG
jgi:hypothetical protein